MFVKSSMKLQPEIKHHTITKELSPLWQIGRFHHKNLEAIPFHFQGWEGLHLAGKLHPLLKGK
jgi:hypothetical protein